MPVRGGMLLDNKKRHLKVQRICNHLPLYLSVCMKLHCHLAGSPHAPSPQNNKLPVPVLTPKNAITINT